MQDYGKAVEYYPNIVVLMDSELTPARLGYEGAQLGSVVYPNDKLSGELAAANLSHGAAKHILRGA